jgi:hypothetical protein
VKFHALTNRHWRRKCPICSRPRPVEASICDTMDAPGTPKTPDPSAAKSDEAAITAPIQSDPADHQHYASEASHAHPETVPHAPLKSNADDTTQEILATDALVQDTGAETGIESIDQPEAPNPVVPLQIDVSEQPLVYRKTSAYIHPTRNLDPGM